MASLFCKAIFKPCELAARGCMQACECCGKCCAECGKCTDECCTACSKACAPCCECLGNSCSWLGKLWDKPFGGCVIFTFLANFIPLCALIYFLVANFSNDCAKPLHTWLVIMLVLFVVNSVFGCYIYRRVSTFDDEDITKHPKWNPAQNYSRNSLSISMDFWMNDPWVCIHIVVSIFSIVWAILGLVWVSDSNGDMAPCPNALADASIAAAIIMLVFITLGVLSIFLTLCTGYLEHCLNDCNIIHCLCCCFYYPFFYRYDPNFEGDSARRARERRQLRAGQHQPLVGNGSPVVMAQPVYSQPVVMGTPLHQQQPTYQQPPQVVVQPVMAQPTYMQTPQQQQAYPRTSYQATAVGSTPATVAPATTAVVVQQEPDSLDRAKVKAQAVADATGEKLKEGAQAFKEWWNKPKDQPKN